MSKKLRYTIIILFLIAVCFFFGKRMYINNIEGNIHKDSGLTVNIGVLTFYKLLWCELSVRNFSIRNPYEYKFRDAVTVRKIDVFIELGKLLSGQKVIDSVVLNGMNINYFVKKSANNISEILATASETSDRRLNELIKRTKNKKEYESLKINKVKVINSTLTLYIAGNQPVVVPLQNMIFENINCDKGNIYIVIVKSFIEILQKVVDAGLNSKSLKVFNSLDKNGRFYNNTDSSKNEMSDLISKLAN
ncbi:MAG TPA: AsmA family protein [Victivallales bacterium]|nr:AsmA family protein [Victivallales bacterium]